MNVSERAASLLPAAEAALGRSYLAEHRMFRHGLDASGGESACRPSPRYSAIAALGLLCRAGSLADAARADRIRSRVADVVDALHERAAGRVSLTTVKPGALSVGDLGLILWLDALTARERAAQTLDRLWRATDRFAGRRLARVSAMELAWVLLGCIEARGVSINAASAAETVRRWLTDVLMNPGTHLFPHRVSGLRRYVANFADQVYPVMALARYSAVCADRAALAAAERCAQFLVSVQGPQGEWPWLYDTDHGVVAERYPVFTVHQYGMAPMALEALGEAGGARFPDAVGRSLAWVFGENELGAVMADAGRETFFRAIGRTRLAACLAAARGALVPRRPGAALWAGRPRLVINRAARSYEPGWLLHAWSGRKPPSDASDKGETREPAGTYLRMPD